MRRQLRWQPALQRTLVELERLCDVSPQLIIPLVLLVVCLG